MLMSALVFLLMLETVIVYYFTQLNIFFLIRLVLLIPMFYVYYFINSSIDFLKIKFNIMGYLKVLASMVLLIPTVICATLAVTQRMYVWEQGLYLIIAGVCAILFLNQIKDSITYRNYKTVEAPQVVQQNQLANDYSQSLDKETNEQKGSRPVAGVIKQSRTEAYEEAIAELNNLVGLNMLRDEVEMFIANIEIMKEKEKAGFKTQKGSTHMVFAGPPGVGKTTVARIMSKILYGLGYLSKGQCIETDKEGLVAQYVGHTSPKTKEMIRKALGGVLFIDEAYSLTPRPNGFEQDAIDTLVKEMEDNREDLIVIFAGYEDEMSEFIQSNPGLESRIPYTFHFEPYTLDELLEIALRQFADKKYQLNSHDAEIEIENQITLFAQQGEKLSKSNARMIRNFIERVEKEQSLRLHKIADAKERRKQLMTITSEDLRKAGAFIIAQ